MDFELFHKFIARRNVGTFFSNSLEKYSKTIPKCNVG